MTCEHGNLEVMLVYKRGEQDPSRALRCTWCAKRLTAEEVVVVLERRLREMEEKS